MVIDHEQVNRWAKVFSRAIKHNISNRREELYDKLRTSLPMVDYMSDAEVHDHLMQLAENDDPQIFDLLKDKLNFFPEKLFSQLNKNSD